MRSLVNVALIKNVVIGICLVVGFSSRVNAQLTLEQVIREVCTKSDSAKMMKESVLRSSELVRENKSAAWPKLSLSTSANYSSPYDEKIPGSGFVIPDSTPLRWGMFSNMIEGFATPRSSTTLNGTLSLSVPIYTFGKIGSAINVANTYNKFARIAYARNVQTLQLTAVDMFYRTMIAIESADIAEKTLTRKNDLYGFIERNFQMGSGVKAQLLMTKADAYSQTAVVLAAKQNAESAKMYLNAFLGRPLSESWTIDTTSIPSTLRDYPSPLTEETVKKIVDSRDDIRSLRLLAESNRSGAKIYKSMRYPSIYGNGTTGYTQVDSKGLFAREGTFDWGAGISLNWTLFDGFQASAKASQYLSDARKLEITEGTAKKGAEIEIRSAESECAAADSSLAATQEMFKAASEAYELTNSNYKQGSGTLADLQRVDEQLQMAEFSLLNARYRQVRSRAALLVAMGNDIIKVN